MTSTVDGSRVSGNVSDNSIAWMDRTGPPTHQVADGIVEAVLDGLRPVDPQRA